MALKYLFLALALIAGFFVGRGCSPDPKPAKLIIRTRLDTVVREVQITKYLTLAGKVKRDSIPCRDGVYTVPANVTFDSTFGQSRVAGSVDCLTGETRLFVSLGDTVRIVTIAHDTLREFTPVKEKSTLSLHAFGESDVLHGITLTDASLGVTGNLSLGPLTLYVKPYYNTSFGLACRGGLSITLWEK